MRASPPAPTAAKKTTHNRRTAILATALLFALPVTVGAQSQFLASPQQAGAQVVGLTEPQATSQASQQAAPLADTQAAPQSRPSMLNFPGAPQQAPLSGQPAAVAEQSPPAADIARALTGAEPLRPPRGIHETSFWAANGSWLIPVFVLIVVAAAVALYVRRRLLQRPVPVDPRSLALSRIEAAKEISDDKHFATAVSDAVRSYLEARFQLRAPEQTTEEFLHLARANQHLPQPTIAELAVLLELCDLAKFARQGLASAQRDTLSQTARQLVDLPAPTAETAATTAAPSAPPTSATPSAPATTAKPHAGEQG